MLEGVTVLAELPNMSVGGTIIGIIIGVALIIFAIVLLIMNHVKLDRNFGNIIIACFIIVFGVALLVDIYMTSDTASRYKVLIDKDVSLIEFNEKYEIIEQEGLIYTIKEK